jgi:arginase
MAVSLIQVPYMLGDERQGASEGPARLVEAGALDLFERRGTNVCLERIERGGAYRDTATASVDVGKRLAATVRRAVAEHRVPVILAGSCDVGKGVISGIGSERCGIVWVDAHADFNTPETTSSGFFAGMSLAIVLGHCYTSLWADVGDGASVSENATLLLGVRDVDPAERTRLATAGVDVVRWQGGEPAGDVAASMDRLSSTVESVYLHIDVDALDPSVAPGVVDEPVPGGLSTEDVVRAIDAVAARFRIRAATLATYDPRVDEDDRTLRTCLRIIAELADALTPERGYRPAS